MPYTHHSHSGSYCKHAHDTLKSVIDTALEKKFKIFCLTEHVPRLQQKYLYPEEKEIGFTVDSLNNQFEEYVKEARKYQTLLNSKDNGMKILVGFESEGGIDDAHLQMCIQLRKDINADLVVGSVHHVNGIDIDFDQETWNIALLTYGSLRGLYKEYFTLVKNMIAKLKPEVVAHFDLIRLFSNKVVNGEKITLEEYEGVCIQRDWPEVWQLITESVTLIVENGLAVELNSSAIRKGWSTPYPKDDIVKLMISKHVKFVLSDDSHGDDQVGLNYQFVLQYIKDMNIHTIWYYDMNNGKVGLKSVTVEELSNDPFWENY
ncbi:hypothetical protein CANINC_001878 [Pichia inconspicua]|uniref:Histidinol-phosphatase n=1 Tax=Pichia inconspicua TaxID=52247 RepID=A0A4T0X4C7_9ASCO|nr:hypothetical protein CANINC_001878 [[Candida] inconspicua]